MSETKDGRESGRESKQIPLTPFLNQHNIEFVRAQIELKKKSCPFYATEDYASDTITDMDHFPYTRYYRGVSYFPDPIVLEREAGWRQRHPECYKSRCAMEKPAPPNYCWSIPATTVLPCNPEFFTRYQDNNRYNELLDAKCITQYR